MQKERDSQILIQRQNSILKTFFLYIGESYLQISNRINEANGGDVELCIRKTFCRRKDFDKLAFYFIDSQKSVDWGSGDVLRAGRL